MKDAPDEHVHALPPSRLSPLLEDVIPTLLVPDVIEQLLRVGGPEAAPPTPHRTLAAVITTTPSAVPDGQPDSAAR